MPYILPEDLTPPARRCVRFFIPNEIWYEAAFWGAVQELIYSWNWEGQEQDKATVTSLWQEVIQTARQSWELGDCDLPVSFRVAGGRIEYSPDSGATWLDIGDACNCETSQIMQPQYNPDTPTYEDRACNIAIGLINWLMEKYNDNIDAVEAAADTVSAMDAVIAIFPPAYLVADYVLDAINEIVEAGASAARAWETTDRREAMSEWLYCEMTETGELSPEIWADFLTAMQDEEFGAMVPGGLAMLAYLTMFEVDAVIARARIESYSEGNCVAFNCGEGWTHTFDFKTTQSLDGWARYNTSRPTLTIDADGMTASGVYTDTNGAQFWLINGFKALTYADATTRLTSVGVSWLGATAGNGDVSGHPTIQLFVTPAVGAVKWGQAAPAGGQARPDGSFTYDGNPATTFNTTDQLKIYFVGSQRNAGGALTGRGSIEKITISGTGKNPFIP